MKIAVIAGTPVDTSMGVFLLSQHGIHVAHSIAISKDPAQQTLFQVADYHQKIMIMSKHFEQLHQLHIRVAFIYCNSLTAAIDFESLGKRYNILVITPLQMYRQIAQCYDKLALLTANAQGASGIEKEMARENSTLNLITIAMIELVKYIEEGIAPQHIIQQLSLDVLLRFLELQQPQALIIGCTHFPYLMKEIKRLTNLPVINPADMMIKELQKIHIFES